MTGSAEGSAAIVSFLFDEIGLEQWWVRSDETDAACTARFADLWTEWRSRVPDSFLGSPREALAGVILFDQFPRNMFRHHADAFSTDSLALAIARGGVDRGLDDAMSVEERSIFYMPFQHSEALADQERSLALFTALGDDNALGLREEASRHDRPIWPLPRAQRRARPRRPARRAGCHRNEQGLVVLP